MYEFKEYFVALLVSLAPSGGYSLEKKILRTSSSLASVTVLDCLSTFNTNYDCVYSFEINMAFRVDHYWCQTSITFISFTFIKNLLALNCFVSQLVSFVWFFCLFSFFLLIPVVHILYFCPQDSLIICNSNRKIKPYIMTALAPHS